MTTEPRLVRAGRLQAAKTFLYNYYYYTITLGETITIGIDTKKAQDRGHKRAFLFFMWQNENVSWGQSHVFVKWLKD